MKKVTIDGKEYEVPDEATWIATDADDQRWWYDEEPKEGIHGYYNHDCICGAINNIEWKNSKRRI